MAISKMLNAKTIIFAGTRPSTGCTEPVAVAWACALATQAVGGKPQAVQVRVDGNVYKNAIAVGIPFSLGKYGLEYAAALGCGGDPSVLLRVLETVSPESRDEMFALLEQEKVKISLNEATDRLWIEAQVTTDRGIGSALITERHTNLLRLTANGQDLPLPCYCKQQSYSGSCAPQIGKMKLKQLIALGDDIDSELSDWIWQGIDMDMRIARQGLELDYGLCLGKRLQRLVQSGLLGDDAANYASYMTAAAVDARMAGATLPVMTNAGSGNQGLGTVVPVMAFAAYNGINDRQALTRAVVIAHLISLYVKEHTGVLSYICGCAHGATAGAAAGILSLVGSTAEAVSKAVQNITADLTGIICDGGKPGCALKLALSAGEAVRISLLAAAGLEAQPADGIVGVTAEESIAHIGKISQSCAATADQAIIEILEGYHRQKRL